MADPILCKTVPELSTVVEGFRTMQSTYTERKHLSLMEDPLVSEGKIYFIAPNLLKMVTVRPFRQTLTIDGQSLLIVQHDLGKEDRLDLGQVPTARAMVRSILEVLAGRVTELENRYHCTAERDGKGYVLDLVPTREPMISMVTRLRVRVEPALGIKEIVTEEKDGDRTVLTLTNVEYDGVLTRDDSDSY